MVFPFADKGSASSNLDRSSVGFRKLYSYLAEPANATLLPYPTAGRIVTATDRVSAYESC